MSVKTQLLKLKENWLIIVLSLIFIIIIAALVGNSGPGLYQLTERSLNSVGQSASFDEAYDSKAMIGIYPGEDGGFAPQIEERKLVKTSELSTEVKRGEFADSENQLKSIIAASDSFLLNENVKKYGTGVEQYYRGSYQIKVEAGKYDSVISQLKQIGEVQDFNENTEDITGSYANLEIELATEKSRLERYRAMYNEATKIEDKINLNDRIFNQERTVKYYEDRLANLDSKIDYSTVSVTITEKKSNFFSAKFVELSELIGTIVGSLNSLLVLIFAVIPYLILIALIYLIIRLIRKKRR
jgi:hypothetical protein